MKIPVAVSFHNKEYGDLPVFSGSHCAHICDHLIQIHKLFFFFTKLIQTLYIEYVLGGARDTSTINTLTTMCLKIRLYSTVTKM